MTPPDPHAARMGDMKTARPTHPTCATCAHFTRPRGDRLVAGTAFGACTQLEAGHYRAPAAACRFAPSRWVARRA